MTARSRPSKSLDPVEIDAGEPLGGELARFDPAGELGDGRVGDRGIVARERGRVARGADEAVAAGPASGATSSGFQRVAGATVSGSATFRGPVRRSIDGASDRRQLPAAWVRSAGVIVTCTSRSASSNVAAVTSGPTPGAVPKVGGAPGVGAPGPAAGAGVGDGASLTPPRHAAMTAARPSGACSTNSRRLCMGNSGRRVGATLTPAGKLRALRGRRRSVCAA